MATEKKAAWSVDTEKEKAAIRQQIQSQLAPIPLRGQSQEVEHPKPADQDGQSEHSQDAQELDQEMRLLAKTEQEQVLTAEGQKSDPARNQGLCIEAGQALDNSFQKPDSDTAK